MKVSKFGGTSLADADQIRKVLAIIQSDPERKIIVVSAPGKRSSEDQKITDLLYEWHRLRELRLSSDEIRPIVQDRFAKIILDLGIKFDLEVEMTEISQRIAEGATVDYAASRGEYLIGKIVAVALGYKFVDPATYIRFDRWGRYEKSEGHIRLALPLRGMRVVIPGFYGSMPDGSIKTFSRGGSDITGAIVAAAIGAEIYENWTDVSGLLMVDPRVVENPKKIKTVTYREMRELAYMGANVFHEEAMFPVQDAKIATSIRNTNDPEDDGTCIVVGGEVLENKDIITGIAGRKDFTVIRIEKKMMNQEVGFARKILSILESEGISFEHMPSGIDTLSVIIDERQLGQKLDGVLNGIWEICLPDGVVVDNKIAMIAVVGREMAYTPGVAARVFTALAEEGINVRMINQGSSEISIIIGVKNDDYEGAIRAIYRAFVK